MWSAMVKLQVEANQREVQSSVSHTPVVASEGRVRGRGPD
jgi:hypothetical protein